MKSNSGSEVNFDKTEKNHNENIEHHCENNEKKPNISLEHKYTLYKNSQATQRY